MPPEGVSQSRHDWLCTLREKALELSLQVDQGEISSDVEALAQFVEFAAPHYSTAIRNPRGPGYTENRKAMAIDIGIVLGGVEFIPIEGTQSLIEDQGGLRNTLRNLWNRNLTPGQIARSATHRCTDTNYASDSMCQYYTGFDAFESRGFKKEYEEVGGNQVAHFGGGMSALGNLGQVGLQAALDQERNPPDRNLYVATLNLWRSNTRITRWGKWIREHLAEK